MSECEPAANVAIDTCAWPPARLATPYGDAVIEEYHLAGGAGWRYRRGQSDVATVNRGIRTCGKAGRRRDRLHGLYEDG